jgi:hypothetical protein
MTAAPSSATGITITELPPGWVQIDFAVTVTHDGFDWDAQAGVSYPAFIRWNLEWWNPATDPNRGGHVGFPACPTEDPWSHQDHSDCYQYGVGFHTESGFGSYDILGSEKFSPTEIAIYWDAGGLFVVFILTGDFVNGIITGGHVKAGARDVDYNYATFAPLPPAIVPEPSTLAYLIVTLALFPVVARRGGAGRRTAQDG